MTIAYYARKSNDKENDSIENQLAIIDSYISSKKDFKGAEVIRYTDSGQSGINLDRDSFQDLLAKVRRREIDVVAVKDLSRLGRNYLDVCKLTDSIFPFMDVRVISVAEDYDSLYRSRNSMDLGMAFKAILNEYYVLESSEKVRNAYIAKIKKGEFCGNIAYGYFLSDKNSLVIDEEKAKVIREIFTSYLDGKSTLEIAKILNERGLLTNRNKKWVRDSVKRILKNEQYIGKKVALNRSKDVKTKRYKPTDESEWYINETDFPPIIERETFDKVQAILPKEAGKDTREYHIMARKLYCLGCNWSSIIKVTI